MRKIITLVLVVMFLAVALSYAQVARSPEQEDTGASVFTNVVVTGLEMEGVPGYVGLRGTGTGQRTFYLYVNDNGELMIASKTQVAASGVISDWANAGTKVGAQ